MGLQAILSLSPTPNNIIDNAYTAYYKNLAFQSDLILVVHAFRSHPKPKPKPKQYNIQDNTIAKL